LPPPKPKNIVEGIEIVDLVDPILASRAAKQAMTFDDLKAVDEVPPEETEYDEVPQSTQSVKEEPVEVGKKRVAESPEKKSTKGTKKSKTVTVDEDF
jgi:hypothetical protein